MATVSTVLKLLGKSPAKMNDFDQRVEDLWPQCVAEYSMADLFDWSQQDIDRHMIGDPLIDNVLLNKWEFVHGRHELKSYPWRLSLPFMRCNARCDFCAAWLMHGKFAMIDTVKAMLPAIRHAWQLDLVGWGEPLIHDDFAAILDLLRTETDPRARLALTTNGSHLKRWTDRLLDANVRDFAISLHATNSVTHQDLMGFGPSVFGVVIDAIQYLVERKQAYAGVQVELVFVVMQQNIDQIPAFLTMAEQLGVDQVHLRTLMPQAEPRPGLDYHRLPPYLHPDFARLRDVACAAIAQAKVRTRSDPSTWSHPIFEPTWEPRLSALPITPRERRSVYPEVEMDWDIVGAGEPNGEPCVRTEADNPLNRSAPLYCPSPYTAFYINAADRRTIPCVYMHQVPGHNPLHFKPTLTFDEVWNAPSMQAVRKSQFEGPLMPACRKCPFYC